MQVDVGSFRDPSGQVFVLNGTVYRSVFEHGIEAYKAARDSKAFDDLINAGLLVPHEEVNAGNWAPDGTIVCLRHLRVPMVSYPWEWPFSLLKDAALIHLEAMTRLILKGFWLRDASAFNVQYDGSRLRLIDTLSVGPREPGRPWPAYGQFCSHFLGPLALGAYDDIRLLSLWRNYIDGFPLDLVAKLLPFLKKWIPGIFMHLILHARAQKTADKKEDIGSGKAVKEVKVSDRGLTGIVRSLHKTVMGINWKPQSALWEEYEEIRTYESEDVVKKSEYVNAVVSRLASRVVWDLGANKGEFSLIAASQGAFVVSIDSDPACSESLYQKIAGKDGVKGILPLTMDLANPSPGLGWHSKERLNLSERGPADLVMALALIHHLVLSSCVPLELVAQWLSELGRYLLVEFVPAQDPMVIKLLRNRDGDHLPYNLDIFKERFGKYFKFEDELPLQNGRLLFLCKRFENGN